MLRLMFNRVTIEKRQEAQHCHPYRIKLLRSQVFLKVECMLDPLKEKQGAIGQLRDVGEERAWEEEPERGNWEAWNTLEKLSFFLEFWPHVRPQS